RRRAAPTASASEPEALEHRVVAAPPWPRLDVQLEEHLVPEQVLDLRPRTRADLLHHGAALADHDLLLGLGLDEDRRPHDLVPELVDLDRDRVRDLLPREVQRLLADQLGDVQLGGYVAALACRVVRRPL